ncbi:MAG: hypothetical protein LDL56_09375 [Armatimonadetes bacterium]|nr:hypothetical protein [Armatimonadota bacterium]MCA1997424.1 hypothetical protein [Armatimonadota bacterium]
MRALTLLTMASLLALAGCSSSGGGYDEPEKTTGTGTQYESATSGADAAGGSQSQTKGDTAQSEN